MPKKISPVTESDYTDSSTYTTGGDNQCGIKNETVKTEYGMMSGQNKRKKKSEMKLVK